MHIAADHGSPELINSLLKAKADPNVTDEVSLQTVSVFAAFSCVLPMKTCFVKSRIFFRILLREMLSRFGYSPGLVIGYLTLSTVTICISICVRIQYFILHGFKE